MRFEDRLMGLELWGRLRIKSSIWKLWDSARLLRMLKNNQTPSKVPGIWTQTLLKVARSIHTVCVEVRACVARSFTAIPQLLQEQTAAISPDPGMLLPCRFCTRMSLICPINSSRSNQSSHSCPAIWCCRDPGSGSHTKLPRVEEEEKLLLLLLQRTSGLSIVQPADREHPSRVHRLR